ncbi:MAG: hypothetical protein H6825_08340 [Planctomycetes bacterium]|nr:hypothetical protein [Planctomycetota bacterium]
MRVFWMPIPLEGLVGMSNDEEANSRDASWNLVNVCLHHLGDALLRREGVDMTEDEICAWIAHVSDSCDDSDARWIWLPSLRKWRLDQVLFTRYGGRLSRSKFSLSGLSPSDAYADFFREQEALGWLEFRDPRLREIFYDRLLRGRFAEDVDPQLLFEAR